MFVHPIQICLGLILVISCSSELKEKYFKQKLDHFSYTNSKHFHQRYLESDDYYQPGGPIFFYCGNEGDIYMFANNTGLMWELAPLFRAKLVFAEHRYYGKSSPVEESCQQNSVRSCQRHSNEKFGYLSVEQALMDYAGMLMKLYDAPNKKVIAFGGSYGGMLAAWLRIKYPHLVVGALAASAPILQFSNLTSCQAFSEVTTKAFMSVCEECAKSINVSWHMIRSISKIPSNLEKLSKWFHLCQVLVTKEDVDVFINWLSDIWNFLAMTNYPYATNFLNPLPANPIEVACSHLTNPKLPPKKLLKNIAKAAFVFLNYTGEASCCFNISESTTNLGMQAWEFQSCTEMVTPMCNTGVTDMFEPLKWNFEEYKSSCEKNLNVTPNLLKMRLLFGGNKLEASSNIIFSNGLMDPWSAGGVLKDISSSIIAITIADGAHHFDLRYSNAADPKSVVIARKKEAKIIKCWLGG